jgi:hypothetical protein
VLPARLRAASAFCRPGTDKVALHVGQAAEDGNHQAAGACGGVSPRLGQRAELRARIHDSFDDGEQVESRASEAVDPSHRHHVAGLNAFEELQQFAAVGTRATLLLAVNLRTFFSPELFKLGIECLAGRADASVAVNPAYFRL